MSVTNGDVAKHAYELAEMSRGLPRMAALCVSVAAATTDTICRARAALEIVPHSGLRQAAQTLLADLAEEPAADAAAFPFPPDGVLARLPGPKMGQLPDSLSLADP